MLKIFLILVLSALFLLFPGCTGTDSPSVTDDIQNGVNNAVDKTQDMADDMMDEAQDMTDGMDGTNDVGNRTNDTSVTGNSSINNMQ